MNDGLPVEKRVGAGVYSLAETHSICEWLASHSLFYVLRNWWKMRREVLRPKPYPIPATGAEVLAWLNLLQNNAKNYRKWQCEKVVVARSYCADATESERRYDIQRADELGREAALYEGAAAFIKAHGHCARHPESPVVSSPALGETTT